jgi:aminoglycoside 3-N-acetyltransferase
MRVTKDTIARDLRSLGLARGHIVLVHSSLSAIGEVEGGAAAVIEALLEVVGDTGTVMMPAMARGIFDVEKSPSTVGAITEAFRHWPGARRSFHPTHSVAAVGPHAEYLTQGHLECERAIGPGTPFAKLVELGGYVLLLGCDQDRNTLLHYAEDLADLPYLTEHSAQYVDEEGRLQTKVMPRYPGPHRDFIGLDRMFREAGVMRIGKVGRAVCRLMKARESIDLLLGAIARDPAAVLCDNPACADCVTQRAAIKRHRLTVAEDFTFSVVLDELGEDLAASIAALQREGVTMCELGPRLTGQLPNVAGPLREAGIGVSAVQAADDWTAGSLGLALSAAAQAGARHVVIQAPSGSQQDAARRLTAGAREAQQAGLTLLLENRPGTACQTDAECLAVLKAVDAPSLRFAFNPAHFATVNQQPFLGIMYKSPLKHFTRQLYIADARFGEEEYVLPVQGNGELAELVSILRCRSFDGFMTLKMGGTKGIGAFHEHMAAFWRLLDNI